MGLALGSELQAQSTDLRRAIAASTRKGMDYLRLKQGTDGAWQRYPGITALAALGFLRNGVGEKDQAIARACAYLASNAKPNGAIYTDSGKAIHIVRKVILRVGAKLDWLILKLH